MAASDNFWVGLLLLFRLHVEIEKSMFIFSSIFAFYLLRDLKDFGQPNSEKNNNEQRWRVQNLQGGGRERRQGKEENTEYCSVGAMSVRGGMEKMLQFS